jgi:two-component system sensor histidine kinase MprB
VVNAIKFTGTKGEITVAATSDGEPEVTITDIGVGIAEDDLPHVFDRFYRSQESRSMPGSGLGLSIVRQIAERHSGTVEAGTSPAGGARLTLSLPGSTAPVPDWTPAP